MIVNKYKPIKILILIIQYLKREQYVHDRHMFDELSLSPQDNTAS